MNAFRRFAAVLGGALVGVALLSAPLMIANSDTPLAATYWIVHTGGAHPDFRLTATGEGRIEPVGEDAFSNADRRQAAQLLERKVNQIHARLAMDGFFSLSKVSQENPVVDLKARRIQPVVLKAPVAGAVMDGGVFIPPRAFRSTGTMPSVNYQWLSALNQGSARGDGPENYKHAWRDNVTPIAYMLANQAVMRAAIQQIDRDATSIKLWRPGEYRGDAVGSAIFNGTVLALTKYGASETMFESHPTGSIKPYDFVYGYDYDDFRKRGIRENGATPAAILGISTTWAEPWAGLEAYEYTSTNVAVGPVTGMMASILSNGGPGAIHSILSDPFPYMETSSGRSVKEWLNWLDRQIRASGNKPGAWQGHTQFVAERGLAGAYVTALSDLLALPRRIENTSFRRPMPESFVNGAYLDDVYKKSPCQDFEFSLGNPVQEISLNIPELASRCIRVRWTGDGYGPDFTGPPVLLTIDGEGMKAEDYDDILMASAEGEMLGLTVVDTATQGAVKYWSMPYRIDYKGGEWMTLAFANIAPEVTDTRERKIAVTIGTGLTSGSGTVSTVADASKAGSVGECRPQKIVSPTLYGAVPHPLGAQGDGSLTLLTGLSSLTKDSKNAEAAIQVAMCTAETFGRSVNAKNEVSLGLSRDAPDESRESCLSKLNSAMIQLTKEPKQVEVLGIELRPKDGMQIDPSSKHIPVDAEVEVFDPALVSARRTSQVDYRGHPTVYLEGVVTFQIRTETRVRGRVDLKVPPDRVLDQGDCDGSASGAMTFVFDIVSAFPFNETAAVVPPDILSVMEPNIWAIMSASQKQEAVEAGQRARAEALSGGQAASGGGQILGAAHCDCSCTEYNDPSRRAACSADCLDFQVTAPQCVIEREVGIGRSRKEITELLNSCPTDCGALSRADPLCRESFPSIQNACMADSVTEADKACYLTLFSQDMPEPMKSELTREMKKQLAGMDQDMLKLTIRPQLEALKEQGKSCPAN